MPVDAVAPKVTVPVPILELGVVPVIVGIGFMVTVASLFVDISLLHCPTVLLVQFMILIVVLMGFVVLLIKGSVVNVPLPAVVTVMVFVIPVAALEPI